MRSSQNIPAEESAGQGQKCLMVGPLLVPNTRTAKLIKPSESTLDNPSPSSMATAMFCVAFSQKGEDTRARAAQGRLEAPKHLARSVHDLYFEPQYEEFGPRTVWSLSNAFTSAFKELEPIPQFKATAELGEFLAARFSQSF